MYGPAALASINVTTPASLISRLSGRREAGDLVSRLSSVVGRSASVMRLQPIVMPPRLDHQKTHPIPFRRDFRAPPRPKWNIDPNERIADMDMEVIDKGMILPTSVGTFCSVEDTRLEPRGVSPHAYCAQKGNGRGQPSGPVISGCPSSGAAASGFRRAGSSPPQV
jgi:hypothetical protein